MTRHSPRTRAFLRNGVFTAAMVVALGGPAMAEPLTISNWDGYMAPDAIENFNSQTGNEAELVLHATNEEIMGKLIASKGAGYDVVFVSSPFAEVLHNLGLAETLDHSKIPNLANLYKEATELPHDPGNAFSVPYAWGTTGLCYRSDLVKDPTSWDDLLSRRKRWPARPRCWQRTAGCSRPVSLRWDTRSTKPTRTRWGRSATC